MKKPLLSELTLEEKVGQMLLIYEYFINCKVDKPADVETGYRVFRTPEERVEILKREKYGTLYASVGDFSRGAAPNLDTGIGKKPNSAPYGKFKTEQASHHWIPALTSTDIEREGAGCDFADLSLTCGPNAQGATNDEKLTYELAAAVAREARCAGITWRWAPVVDIANRFSMSVIRSYAPHDPDKQIRFAVAQIQGTQSEGVAATAKHFPGHDPYEYRDAHLCPAKIRSTKEEWWAGQGKIFQGCIDGGVYSIMIGHTSFPAYDDSKVGGRYRPATISKKIITDLAFHEFEIIEGVKETLEALQGHYRLIVATKGDLTEQMGKFRISGLAKYFHHCEVMENKDEKNYLELAAKNDMAPEQILMVGNSVKADIAPVVALGGTAFHTPHEVVWVHEMMDMPQSDRIIEVRNIKEILQYLL